MLLLFLRWRRLTTNSASNQHLASLSAGAPYSTAARAQAPSATTEYVQRTVIAYYVVNPRIKHSNKLLESKVYRKNIIGLPYTKTETRWLIRLIFPL